MNIFLPYENDLQKSIESLDDVRLNKQILECDQLWWNAYKESKGQTIKGYAHHPVYVFYKDNLDFITTYAYLCCCEYQHRYNKEHCYTKFFEAMMPIVENLQYTPYYMSGSKNSPNCIRTTENVSQLFQDKLNYKWQQDILKKRPPKWTNRNKPEFYKGE